MSTLQKVLNFIAAILMIVCSVLLITLSEKGFYLVALILFVSLLVYGIRELIFYFTMASYMVGGRRILYLGVLIIDIALFSLSLSDVSPVYIMIYLIVIHAFSGVINILRALEQKKLGAGGYKWQLFTGIVNLLVAVACGAFIRSMLVCVYIYTAGLLYSAIVRIIRVFAKNPAMYITP